MRITKTRQSVLNKQSERDRANAGCATCPECGRTNVHSGICYYNTKGIFNVQVRQVNVYVCPDCGSEWESEPFRF